MGRPLGLGSCSKGWKGRDGRRRAGPSSMATGVLSPGTPEPLTLHVGPVQPLPHSGAEPFQALWQASPLPR